MGVSATIGVVFCAAVVALSWAALFSEDWVHTSSDSQNRAGVIVIQPSGMSKTTWDNDGAYPFPDQNFEWALGLWSVGSLASVVAFLFGLLTCCLGLCCICCLSIPFAIVNAGHPKTTRGYCTLNVSALLNNWMLPRRFASGIGDFRRNQILRGPSLPWFRCMGYDGV
ncbi:hypothetical protein, variant [Sphaeroforma arctica JP610]|uniref:Uncharacterized protein n=1 Tax=Sphaeroforma arctica JP610 TaxID=667725 RepID=A0A0L0GG07_9EUKA|nr:hypothetical protein, variant [Sphaeroforma arctica JP610]KNC87794.1 hypothetical protein, variant [Sphaeroforma arctica JP610]|eukprot:XP_014161697.1 hypothetical protein, variant [Sphaeroforma arctica JP610]